MADDDQVEDKGYRPKNPGHFGPSVIGEEQFEKEKEVVESGAHVFGPAVIDGHPATEDGHEAEGGGTRREPDRESSPTVEVSEGGMVVGQFELEHYAGGWHRARHVATDGFLDEDGELTTDTEQAKGFGPGEDTAKDALREFLRELGGETREQFIDQEAGPAVTEPTPHEASDAELTVREAADENGYVSLETQEELLEGAGDVLRDRLVDAEFAREPSPRKGGLRQLIAAEKDREGGPRPRVLNRLERAFAQLTSAPGS